MVQSLLKKWQNKLFSKGLLLALCFITFTTWSQIDTPEDCPDAYRICDATQSYYFEVNGAGAIDDAYGANNVFCIFQKGWTLWEHNSAWFVFTPQYSGEFGFLICPEVTTDNWDWALFENADCANLNDNSTWLRCVGDLPVSIIDGCTGIGFKNGFGGGGVNGLQPYANIIAGNTYILYAVFTNLPSSAPGRATLSFQGSVVTANPDLFTIPSCLMSAEDFAVHEVKVYPNPFNNTLQIESTTAFKTMELYDIMGKQIINKTFVNQLNTSALAQGMYLLRLITEDGVVVVKKVVKE